MSGSIIRFEFYASSELFFRIRPFPKVIHRNVGQRGVRFGKRTVYCKRICSSLSCLWHRFVGSSKIVERQTSVRIGQPGVGKRVSRISFDGLRELRDTKPEAFACSLVPKKT